MITSNNISTHGKQGFRPIVSVVGTAAAAAGVKRGCCSSATPATATVHAGEGKPGSFSCVVCVLMCLWREGGREGRKI